MAYTKPRTKRLALRHHTLPDLDTLERWLEHGDPSGLIQPVALPPDVPRAEYEREHARLMTHLQQMRADWQATDLHRRVRDLLAEGYHEDPVAILLGITKAKVHRISQQAKDRARRVRALNRKHRTK